MQQPLPASMPAPQGLAERVDELAALYRLTDQLYRAGSLNDVYEAALDAITATLGCTRASVLLFDENGIMQFVAWRGLSEHYRATLKGHSPWKAGEPEPAPIFVSDIAQTAEPDWVKTAVAQEGIRALGFIPLLSQGKVIGKFMTYYETPRVFPEREIDLAVTIARQLGFSIERAWAEEARHAAEEDLRESEERFRLMSESAPVMIWVSDPNGACLHLNRMLREFWNVDEKAVAAFNWQDTMHPDDAPAITRQIVDALTRRAEVTIKGRYRDGAGEIRVLETHARPRFSAKGEFLGMIGVNVDITERELTEKALRKSEERFRLAVEAAPSAMVMSDRHGKIVLMNAQAEKLFGYDRDELVGEPIERLVPERYRKMHPRYRDDYGTGPSARPMGVGRDLFCLRKDGREIPVEIGLSPIETPDGVMALAAVVDISERKRADHQRELLLAELNHRVKNTLAVVQGIAYQTFKGENASKDARSAFEGRLVALGVAHNLLTQANWENASMDHLAEDALQATGGNKNRVSLTGPRVLLPPKIALSIAMALHELATNAVKYGALSNDSGRIYVEWRREDGPPPQLKLRWREENGPPVTPPKRRGFGSLLLDRTLAQDLDASVTTLFNPEGLVCEIEVPLPESRRACH